MVYLVWTEVTLYRRSIKHVMLALFTSTSKWVVNVTFTLVLSSIYLLRHNLISCTHKNIYYGSRRRALICHFSFILQMGIVNMLSGCMYTIELWGYTELEVIQVFVWIAFQKAVRQKVNKVKPSCHLLCFLVTVGELSME